MQPILIGLIVAVTAIIECLRSVVRGGVAVSRVVVVYVIGGVSYE